MMVFEQHFLMEQCTSPLLFYFSQLWGVHELTPPRAMVIGLADLAN